ncbi:helix-turn-helix transcriptional regulator [Shimia sediminis]|uniref:helix-turn-helix transcriptional regulator n=1 Tax=Shimia sediminis TaxID=2497945 RepID=UPI000F8DA540|nr:LuxR family transcriptional regulator [Shimia sediminis]
MTEDSYTIDCIDRFVSSGSSAERWEVSQGILADLGASAANVTVVDCANRDFVWFQSSMRQSWLDHYIENTYYEWDPFIDNLRSGYGIYEAKCGMETLETTGDQRVLDLNWKLQDAGYGYLRGVSVQGEIAGTRKYLTFCSDENVSALSNKEFEDRWRIASVLITAFQDPLDPEHTDAYLFGQAPDRLSEREQQILRLLAKGRLNAQIAYDLGVAEVTVRKHLQSARQKLGARTREEALAIALASGELTL